MLNVRRQSCSAAGSERIAQPRQVAEHDVEKLEESIRLVMPVRERVACSPVRRQLRLGHRRPP